MKRVIRAVAVVCGLMLAGWPVAAQVSGELKRWHPVTLTLDGPQTSEQMAINPFRDYRLTVTWTHVASGKQRVVPGYYAADGNAGETSASSGNKWRAHFTPDDVGTWNWVVSFVNGTDIAVSPGAAGSAVAPLDGAQGSVDIAETDKSGRDHRGKGFLEYVGQHYFRYQNGEYFLKGGADSPENFLAYVDFDQTFDTKNCCFLHEYQPHVADWSPGDPTWKGDKGKGIIGALNYLAGKGMNSVYFLPFNVAGGDGGDTWPWTAPDERFRFDVSKLDQWEIVFSHMDRIGITLHVVTQETENDQNLGSMTVKRMLYYRELIARFGHHLALVWNLGEENTNTDQERRDFANFIRSVDPYDHPIVVHTFPGDKDTVYTPLLGFPTIDGPSLQGHWSSVHDETKQWRDASAAGGHRWVVNQDELNPSSLGVVPDGHPDDPNHDRNRQNVLWGNLMAGGGGVEWFFGADYPDKDLTCEDWRSRDQIWDQTRYALEFFRQHLPFTQMDHCDDSVTGSAYCFAVPGEVYAVYLKDGLEQQLTVASGTYDIRWFDPKSGSALQAGSISEIIGPGARSIGTAPFTGDAVALLNRQDAGGGPNAVALALPGTVTLPVDEVTLDGTDSSGAITTYQWVKLSGPAATIENPSAGTTRASGLELGSYTFELTVTDDAGESDSDTVEVRVEDSVTGAGEVTGLTLINADSDQPLGPLQDGEVLDLAQLPTINLNLRAETSPATVGSVRFALDGVANYQIENSAPYTLAGDQAGDYAAWTPPVGFHTLIVTPYAQSGAAGPPGVALTVNFEVRDGDPADPLPAPTNLKRTDVHTP